MTIDAGAVRTWAREHKAAWELLPLVEMHEGARVQVGFALELYARIPPRTPGEEQGVAIEALWDRLREVAESLVAPGGEQGRLEVDPFEAAGRLRPETGFAPEVMLTARLFHAGDCFAAVDPADREGTRPIEARLLELGFKQRSW